MSKILIANSRQCQANERQLMRMNTSADNLGYEPSDLEAIIIFKNFCQLQFQI